MSTQQLADWATNNLLADAPAMVEHNVVAKEDYWRIDIKTQGPAERKALKKFLKKKVKDYPQAGVGLQPLKPVATAGARGGSRGRGNQGRGRARY